MVVSELHHGPCPDPNCASGYIQPIADDCLYRDLQYGGTRIRAGEMNGGCLELLSAYNMALYVAPYVELRVHTDFQSSACPAGGGVLTVLFSVLMGGLSLGQAAPLLQVRQRGTLHSVIPRAAPWLCTVTGAPLQLMQFLITHLL